MRRWFLWRKMYHACLFDFLDGLGGGNDPLNFQNRAIGGFWENARFIRSNGRKTTFEWLKVVSEVILPRFWGVVVLKSVFGILKFWSEEPFLRCRVFAFLRRNGHSHHQDYPKNQKARHGTFFFIRITFSSHVTPDSLRKKSTNIFSFLSA